MSAAFLQQAVAENSSKHTQLLNSLSEFDGIPDALKEQTKLVDDIQSQLGECEDNVARLFEKTRKERRSADPGIIPGGLKFSQVFRGRKEKEREREREERNKRLFAEAMAEETKERERQASLEQALSKAQASKTELLGKMRDYDDIMGRLDALYGMIFNGPTPGYPKEDELEQSVQASYSVIERTRATYNSENEGLEILIRADKTFKECQTKLKDAIYWATALAMLAGGRTAEAKETSSLRIAHSLAQKAQAHVREAQQFSPHIRTLESPSIARELPVRKENDTEFHEVLKASAAELGNTYSQLLSERRACADRTSEARTAVLEAEQTVTERKKELHTLRKATFLEIVSKLKSGELSEPTELDFEGMQDAPPSYALQAPSAQGRPPAPPNLLIGKDDANVAFRQLSTNFSVAPAYESGSASPISTYTATSSHHSSYVPDYPPTTPRTSRPGGGRPPRPLPRVPQSSSSMS
ncbi:hypothetical protein BT96DRAFT_143100 [Gymnopus androsaceus JB14]|uniref:Uncharacterized protein n=1 Tax=Gymnopus androsaceus JB14 TaxID=1447944 RepID=A0A6A4HB76_9AGAR|nr:hypothetical protein BT96DRAFT_143100 [Gymnopus androsaceus JB14]